MIEIGKYNRLKVTSISQQGAIVTDGSRDILVPKSLCNESIVEDAELDLFVYRNSKDKLIATTQKPHGIVGDFVALKVVDAVEIGAFVDWGLEKDLFIPRSQMLGRLERGETVVVHIVFDDISNRVIATPRLRPFLKKPNEKVLPIGTKVTALIYEHIELGSLAVINNKYVGLFPLREFSEKQKIGTKIKAFVKSYNQDGKLSVSRAPVGKEGWKNAEEQLLNILNENDGFLPLNDKSSPDEISRVLGMSKKSFKKVVGGLLKQRKIEITDSGIIEK